MAYRSQHASRSSTITARPQRTICGPVAVEGFGYWTGRDVRVEFRPAEIDTGIVFVRHDLAQPVRIKACIANRIEVPRRTSLRVDGVDVEMVEHILAALAGMQIDNCEVWVDAAEMPGCDGSSLPYVEALTGAGIVSQNAPRCVLVVREVTRLGDAEGWVEARPRANLGMSIKFHLDYGTGNAIGRQTISLDVTPEVFKRELAPCRTFMLKTEADWLLSQGLGTRATYGDLLVFDHNGPIENRLRFGDECARHKALDLIGDLSLCGCDLVGHFVAFRSGHRLNAGLVRALLTEGEVVGRWRHSA